MMMIWPCLVAVFVSLTLANNARKRDTIGGAVAWPWFVSLRYSNGTHKCDATLVTNEWALTTARCWNEGSQTDIVARVVDDNTCSVVSSQVHTGYDKNTQTNDLALVKIICTHSAHSMRPIQLANADDDRLQSQDNVNVEVVGTQNAVVSGRQERPVKSANLTSLTWTECVSSQSDLCKSGSCIVAAIDRTMVCVRTRNTHFCGGTNGGALIINNTVATPTLYGVLSWRNGCGNTGHPAVYQYIPKAVEWIQLTTGMITTTTKATTTASTTTRTPTYREAETTTTSASTTPLTTTTQPPAGSDGWYWMIRIGCVALILSIIILCVYCTWRLGCIQSLNRLNRWKGDRRRTETHLDYAGVPLVPNGNTEMNRHQTTRQPPYLTPVGQNAQKPKLMPKPTPVPILQTGTSAPVPVIAPTAPVILYTAANLPPPTRAPSPPPRIPDDPSPSGDTDYDHELDQLSYAALMNYVPVELQVRYDYLTMGQCIGKGNYGSVNKGQLTVAANSEIDVAIKALLSTAGTPRQMWANLKNFLKEGLRMKDFAHDRVLPLIGISWDTNFAPLIITPFMPNGSLEKYVQTRKQPFALRELLNFAVEIAQGMKYIRGLKLIHRDLATRNCLLDADLHIKIADFGLSRSLYGTDMYGQSSQALPLKWMPPEILCECSYPTDVWSYGVCVWELMTLCRSVPYNCLSSSEAMQFTQTGGRLTRPRNCPQAIYDQLMWPCWAMAPNDRLTFAQICQRLPVLMRQLGEDQLDRMYLTTQSTNEPPSS